jgi:hypothetical protein
MEDRNPNNEYAAIQQHIRRANLQRSVETARILADAANALGHGVASAARFARAVLASMSQARHARTIEADALLGRNVLR